MSVTMDSSVETETPVFQYDTLSPLSLPLPNHSQQSDGFLPFNSTPSTPLNQSPEPCSVFRNEISMATSNSRLVESDAPDFFSLDVAAGFEEFELKTPVFDLTTPLAESKKSTKKKDAAVNAEESVLENGWFRSSSKFKSPMLQLHKEIVDFCDFLSPTSEEQAERSAAVECVFDVIKYIWPNCKAEVFGSYRTGLYLPTSDIDVVILESGIKIPQTGLHALSRALAQRGVAKKIQVIAKARVPIIKFVEKKSGVSFDISFDAQNGPKAAEYIKEAVIRWPQVRPLCLILKVFLQQRDLNEVYSGGISSYALLTMVMAMLQNLRETQASPEHNLGVLLVKFFEFYGRKLNTTDVGVSCKGGGTFFSKSDKGFVNKGRPFLISIEDPQAPENDIGKNSFNYFQIRSAFAMAFSNLTNTKTILGLGQNRSILGTIIRPDPVLLERKGGLNGDVTFTSLLPGAGEPLQSLNGNHQELFGNWQLDDDEPLPRGDDLNGDLSGQSSGKKRKLSSKSKSAKKLREEKEKKSNGKNDSKKDKKSSKTKRWRHNSDENNGGSPWTR